MSTKLQPSNKKNADRVVIWLDERSVYLGYRNSASTAENYNYQSFHWNPDSLTLNTKPANDLLVESMSSLLRQAGVSRLPIRLCLGDSLCVTRVITGDERRVERELIEVRSRSQLYLTLGLGDKLTGQIRLKTTADQEYALTTIVNQRIIQSIYNAFERASLKLDSIEPVTLSIARAMGLLKLDNDKPLLQIFIENNRCDLSITLQGRLMLSYRVGGWKTLDDAAKLVTSHMTRLKRFCERYRILKDANLDRVLLLGSTEHVKLFKDELTKSDTTLKFLGSETYDHIGISSLSSPLAACEIPDIVRLAFHGADASNTDAALLPPPDLLQRLRDLQPSSVMQQLIRNFWPSAVAVCLIAMISLAHLYQSQRLQNDNKQLVMLNERVQAAEEQVREWEHKKDLLGRLQSVDVTIRKTNWTELTVACARCMPNNAKLESIMLIDGKKIILKGTMVSEDRSYEMISSLSTLPMITKVSVESVSSMGSRDSDQMQFDIRCDLKRDLKPSRDRLTQTTQTAQLDLP